MKLGKKVSIHTKEEVRHMAVSMAVVPLLKGEAATKIVDDFKSSKLKPFTDDQRKKTNAKVAEILKGKRNG